MRSRHGRLRWLAQPRPTDARGAGVLLLLTVALFVGCATAPPPSSAPPRAAIDIEELSATDSWRVTYRFSRPLETITFSRDRGALRTSWNVVEPAGTTWKSEGDREVLVLSAPAERLVLEFATNPADRDKDYNLNIAFTDGSRLLYTGHFLIEEADESPWTFRTTPTRDVRLLDRHGRGSLQWPGGDETYVYFGSVQPVVTERMTLIVDPGLPRWIETQIRALAPKQLDYFARQLGTELSFKPLVFLSYADPKAPGLSFKGGTLSGLVQIAVTGEAWATETADAAEKWYSRLSHEIFHLYNSHEFDHGRESEWLAEASADAAALHAMRDNEVIDAARQRQLIVEAANECIVRLEGKPIVDSNPRNYYTCGLVTQVMAGWNDLWPLYRRVMKDGYTTDDFLAAVPADRRAPIEQFLRRGPGMATDVFIAEQLRAAGIAVDRVAPANATLTPNIASWMLRLALVRCAGDVGRIETINGIDPRRKTVEAYTSLLSTPESTVHAGGKVHTVRCTQDPTWEQLLGVRRP